MLNNSRGLISCVSMGGQEAPSKLPPGPVVLTDPRAIRALAHPARLAILEALFEGAELTSTECATLTGLSPSATAYHLKALEKWGIVRPGTRRGDARQRPWTACGLSLEVDSSAPLRSSLAEKAILNLAINRDREAAFRFLDRAASEPKLWRDTVNVHSGAYWLTPAEVDEVVSSLVAIMEMKKGGPRRGNGPAAARRIRISLLTFPDDEKSPS